MFVQVIVPHPVERKALLPIFLIDNAADDSAKLNKQHERLENHRYKNLQINCAPSRIRDRLVCAGDHTFSRIRNHYDHSIHR